MKVESYKNRDWLYQKYWREELSLSQIAEKCGFSSDTIWKWMRKFDIKCRTSNESQKLAQNRPEVNKKRSESLNHGKLYINKDWIYRRYIINKLSPRQIAIEASCTFPTIRRWILLHGFPLRTLSEACKIAFKNRDFLGKNNPHWNGGKIKRSCKICGKNFETRRDRLKIGWGVYCSNGCKTIGIKRDGLLAKENNPMYGKHPITWNKNLTAKEDNRILSGKNHPCWGNFGSQSTNWLDGKSFEPYEPEFNKQFKEFIRKRDNYQCQECGIKENGKAHNCHHIDYDKKNNMLENLILLCYECHGKTGGNREYWQNHFMFSMQLRINNFISQ